MELVSFVTEIITPPKDESFLEKIKKSELTLQDHDVVAISSKIVSIWQGRCVPHARDQKDELIKKEADWYLERDQSPEGAVIHTIKNNVLLPGAGVDPFGGWYVLLPEKPKETAEELLAWFKKTYRMEHLYLVITDSKSAPLRRGVVGYAVSWAGFEPLFDNRHRKDLLGHESGGSQVNVPDSIAAAAVLAMGEANEQTPLVRMRGVPYVSEKRAKREARFNEYLVSKEEDIYAPLLKAPWKKGTSGK
ncbi:MAG TPA: coenzyme F420-0:L-glutamate ligase [Candidatus Paceibacterota bacterium]